ncbi:MAG: RluA family pseudouridine synthase [Lachnospiraceae bacterium]|nr:RluA family pseudouridine synthase [Lachnospiraceae bacterium]
MPVDIIYEDKSIIIIRKSASVATESADVTRPDCVSIIKDHLRSGQADGKGEPYVGLVHRLDQPVAGILVFAKTRKAAAKLSAQVRTDIMNKHYTALVEGIIDRKEEVRLEDMMYKDSKARKAVIVTDESKCPPGPKLLKAALTYHTDRIIEAKNMTILGIRLETGRFHQIRAQLSNMGHPIVGDKKYGATSEYPSGIALVADRLEFTHPDTGEKVEKSVDFSFGL